MTPYDWFMKKMLAMPEDKRKEFADRLNAAEYTPLDDIFDGVNLREQLAASRAEVERLKAEVADCKHALSLLNGRIMRLVPHASYTEGALRYLEHQQALSGGTDKPSTSK
jgi:hypothetical protein